MRCVVCAHRCYTYFHIYFHIIIVDLTFPELGLVSADHKDSAKYS